MKWSDRTAPHRTAVHRTRRQRLRHSLHRRLRIPTVASSSSWLGQTHPFLMGAFPCNPCEPCAISSHSPYRSVRSRGLRGPTDTNSVRSPLRLRLGDSASSITPVPCPAFITPEHTLPLLSSSPSLFPLSFAIQHGVADILSRSPEVVQRGTPLQTSPTSFHSPNQPPPSPGTFVTPGTAVSQTLLTVDQPAALSALPSPKRLSGTRTARGQTRSIAPQAEGSPSRTCEAAAGRCRWRGKAPRGWRPGKRVSCHILLSS